MTEETSTTETEAPAAVGIATATMLGDLVSFLIDELKAAPDCWQKLSQFQQDDVIARATSRCTFAVQQVVSIIAADGRDTITADLEQITAKDGIKAVCTLAKHDPNRHALLDAVGKPVLIVVAGSSQFLGGELPKADPDQQSLLTAGDGTEGDDTPVADNTLAAAA